MSISHGSERPHGRAADPGAGIAKPPDGRADPARPSAVDRTHGRDVAWRRATAFALGGLAVLAVALAIVVVAWRPVRMAAGPLRISASNPGPLLFEAAVLLLLASLVRPARSIVIGMALILVLAVAAAGSEPRRVGDGGEYIAMTLALSEGRPPALTDQELRDTEQLLDRLPAFANSQLTEPPLRRGDRQDFFHFWLFPLAVAPIAAVARAADLPLSFPYTVANVSFLAALAAVLLRRSPPEVAALVVAGPVLWWVDKAHAEVFVVALVGIGLALLRGRSGWGLMALAAAGTQAPPFAPLWVLAVLDVLLVQRRWSRDAWVAIAASGALLALAPAYYLWRLGALTPLKGTTIDTWPGLRAWLTPLIDPNLGLLVYAPALGGLAVVGVWLWLVGRGRGPETSGRARGSPAPEGAVPAAGAAWVSVAGGLILLTGSALTANVNHGGTPGITRYAVWLIAIAIPLAAAGARWISARAPSLLLVVTMLSTAASAYVFHPKWSDRSWAPAPNLVATWLWMRMPSLDNPLPEIFAERMFGADGKALLPIATSGCEKVLLGAESPQVRWPVPCRPQPLPAECRVDGALCYVNGQNAASATPAPRQPGFGWQSDSLGTWTIATESRISALLQPVGRDWRIVRAATDRALVWRIPGVRRAHVVQGSDGLAAWTEPVSDWTKGDPALIVRVPTAMRARRYDAASLEPIEPPIDVPPGQSTVLVPRYRVALTIITRR